MSNRNNTPPINATGVYVLIAPFATVPGAIYRCEAIDGFESLEERNVNVFDTYYLPYGLNNAQFESDRVNGVNIVTIMSDNQPTIFVPSSFIDKYPTTTNVPYSRVILSVDMGALPDGLSLQPAVDSIVQMVSEFMGIPNPGVRVNTVSVTETVSHSQHEQLELNRAARIVEKETVAAAVRRLTAIAQKQQNQINTLNQIVIQQKTLIDSLQNP